MAITAKKKTMRFLLWGLTVLLIQSLILPKAAAAPAPDLSAPCGLTIVMTTSSGEPLPGGSVTLYHVAQWDLSGEQSAWTYTEAYAGCPISTEGLEEQDNADALARFTRRQDIAGESAGLEEGEAHFAQLAPGLYLVVQTRAASGYLPFSPFLLALPLYSPSEQYYSCQVTAYPKTEPEPEDDRPARPTPTPLIPVDPTPGTPLPPFDWPETPSGPDEPPVPSPESPAWTHTDSPTPERPTLPNTGQLWWPVPILAAGGLVMLALAWLLRRRKHEKPSE